jgi:hypothetical protein
MPRGTLAYWRFDSEGMPGDVAEDLTGNGNDLTTTLLHASGRDALTKIPPRR